MNNLIQKAIKAINEDKKDYALGILESLLEMQGGKIETTKETVLPKTLAPSVPPMDNEASMLDMTAKAKLKEIESMIKYE